MLNDKKYEPLLQWLAIVTIILTVIACGTLSVMVDSVPLKLLIWFPGFLPIGISISYTLGMVAGLIIRFSGRASSEDDGGEERVVVPIQILEKGAVIGNFGEQEIHETLLVRHPLTGDTQVATFIRPIIGMPTDADLDEGMIFGKLLYSIDELRKVTTAT